MLTLKVPFSDRVYTVNGDPRDLSIVGALTHDDGRWEPHLMSVMGKVIAPTDICLDIGANIGTLALVMSGLASDGHVYAFEPSQSNAAYLRQNLAANRVSNVTVVEKAVWDGRGELEIFHIDELAGCSFLEADGDSGSGLRKIRSIVRQPWMDEIELHTHRDPVACVSLDEFAAETGMQKLDFIKMDVQGAEIPALTGGAETIARFRPRMIAELAPQCMKVCFGHEIRDCFDLLTRLYPSLCLIEETGSLSSVPDYDWLAERLARGKGWEDLYCSF